ncbi:MAG: hypothetical protein O2916_11780 [Proteobacteria bacterium]|nr:hypothetical protein [Pseudomonadota bacterium]
MAKLDLTIPKGYKCKNGVCEQDLELEIDVPEIKPVVSRLPEVEIKGFNNNQELKPQIVEKEIEKIVKVVPSWQPSFICKGPNCNTKKNPAYTSRPRGVCANCGQFTKEAFGTCIWCESKDIEEIDIDKLNDLGIPTPENNKEDTDEAD